MTSKPSKPLKGPIAGRIGSRSIVVGTGLVALDVVYGLDRQSTPGLFAGGTCANVLAALAFLGWESYPLARIGDDPAGSCVLSDLRATSVRTEFAALAPRRPTPVIVQRIRVDSNGRVVHRFATRCPGCGGFFPQYQPLPLEVVRNVAERIPVPDIVFVDRVSPGAIALAESARRRGALIYFEPSARSARRLVDRMLTTTHILKYSRDQAHHFARPRLATVPLEVETLGASGVRYRGTMFQRGDRAWRSVPGFGVSQLLDTAGAGDWLSAGLIDFLGSVGARELHQLPRAVIEDGLRTAQAFSAWACGFEGARGGMYRQDSETVRGVVKQTLTAGSTGVLVTGAAADSLHEAFPDLCGACGAIASPSESVDSRAS